MQKKLSKSQLKERNKRIAELYYTGKYTMEMIGEEFRISRERVRQLLPELEKKLGWLKRIGTDGGKYMKDPIKIKKKQEREEKVVFLYNEGKYIQQIADVLKISYRTTYVILAKKLGKDLERSGNHSLKIARKERNKEIISLYTTGEYTAKEIAKIFNLNINTIFNILEILPNSEKKAVKLKRKLKELNQPRRTGPIKKMERVKYKGVISHRGKYRATIYISSKQKHLGTYSTAEEAAEAYNKAALHYFGEKAVLNTLPI